MLKGSCACGAVRYQIDGPLLGPVTYCHCWRCRKHSGSSFGTTAGLMKASLTFVQGEERLSFWLSSEGVRRYFASCCGSPIYKEDDAQPGVLGFRLGTLDVDPDAVVSQHYMIESIAPWVVIDDQLDRVRGGDAAFPDRESG